MNATEQTIQKIEKAIRKVAAKYPAAEDNQVLTDIYLQVKADSGELMAFNDDDVELTRCVVEEWIDYRSDNFYDEIMPVLRQAIQAMSDTVEQMALLKPFSFVLIDDEGETVSDIYLVDDDHQIFDGELLKGLDRDLDEFLKTLLDD
ncbi:MAG: hypothetical protein NC388_01570 [Clostridium sp.]|nr:hypothetical protein [Clostridium sp.]